MLTEADWGREETCVCQSIACCAYNAKKSPFEWFIHHWFLSVESRKKCVCTTTGSAAFSWPWKARVLKIFLIDVVLLCSGVSFKWQAFCSELECAERQKEKGRARERAWFKRMIHRPLYNTLYYKIYDSEAFSTTCRLKLSHTVCLCENIQYIKSTHTNCMRFKISGTCECKCLHTFRIK